MIAKDLKKINLLLSTCLTTLFGAIVNIIPQLLIRQIFNPLAIVFSFALSTLVLNAIKSYSNNKVIKNNLLEIDEIKIQISECVNEKSKEKLELEIERLRNENSKLRRDNSKILIT